MRLFRKRGSEEPCDPQLTALRFEEATLTTTSSSESNPPHPPTREELLMLPMSPKTMAKKVPGGN